MIEVIDMVLDIGKLIVPHEPVVDLVNANAEMLGNEGFERVLAEWVWSVQMYERLGFEFWRTRLVEP